MCHEHSSSDGFNLSLSIVLVLQTVASTVCAQKPSSIQKPPMLYASDSVWNQRLPKNPPLDPNSAAMIDGLVQSVSKHGFVMNLNEWSIPVYQAKADTPLSPVTLAAEWSPHTSLLDVPIPSYATPDPLNDGHMVIISADQQCHFDLWQARKVGTRWVASWANAMSLSGSGIYERGLGARAGGFGLLGGLIWPEELENGLVEHALVFATGTTRSGGPVAPATASDGVTAGLAAIPIGAHLQLDPNFDTATLDPPFLRTIAKALQEYGMICGDTTGGSVDLYALNPSSLSSNPYKSILPDTSAPFPSIAGIPAEAFRVLQMPSPDPSSRSEVVGTGCNRFAGEWMNGVRDLAIGEAILLLADGSAGLRILDVSQAGTPQLIATFETDEPATTVIQRESLIFVGTAGAGVTVLDAKDPSDPTEQSNIGLDEALSIASLAIHNNLLYILADDPPLLWAVDVSQPAQPKILAELDDIDVLDTPRDIFPVDSLLYVTDQITQLQIIDISLPTELTVLTEDSDDEFFPNSVVVRDDWAFVTDEDSGLLVFDRSNPVSPQLAGRLDLPDFAFSIDLIGQTALVANGGAGLQVVDVSDPTSPKLLQTLQPHVGYSRTVQHMGDRVYLGSIGGGILIFEANSEQTFIQTAAFENDLGSTSSLNAAAEQPLPPTPPTGPSPMEIRLRLGGYDADRGFSFEIEGPVGALIAIEISDDLEEWEVLDQLTITAGENDFLDDEAQGEPLTFYRVRLLGPNP